MRNAGKHLEPAHRVPGLAFLLALLSPCVLVPAPVNSSPVYSHSIQYSQAIMQGAHLQQADRGQRLVFAAIDRPSVIFQPGQGMRSGDWSDSGGLLLSLHNPESQPLDLCIRIDDAQSTPENEHCVHAYTRLEPGETVRLLLPLYALEVDMKAAPPTPGSEGARVLPVFGPKLDLRSIKRLELFLLNPGCERQAELLDMLWLPRPDVTKVVDRFGQFTRADWPGKIKEETELSARAREEQDWLAAHPALEDRDAFGGWKNGPKLAATGFFRTALVLQGKEIPAPAPGDPLPEGARWWMVTPQGSLFWSTGVACLLPNSAGPIAGREHMFQWIPAAAPDGYVDFYQINLQRKYGPQAADRWRSLTLARLQSWGFNTIGNWSQEELTKDSRTPYTIPVHYGLTHHIPGTNLPDFFAREFPTTVSAAIAQAMASRQADPWLLGVFVDNEINWGAWHDDLNIPRALLAASPQQPARQALIAHLRSKYGSLEVWTEAWGLTAQHGLSWDKPITLPPVEQLPGEVRADSLEFLALMAERYYGVVAQAMKRHAPHHLYLGSRLGTYARTVVDVAAKYCDVVSFNIYESRLDTPKWRFLADLGRPVIVGEFHFGATDRGLFHPGLAARDNQSQRALAMESYVHSALAQPGIVGVHWFQYVDQPLTGRFDGENYNAGLVSITDAPYPELRDAARRVNAEIYRLPTPPASLSSVFSKQD